MLARGIEAVVQCGKTLAGLLDMPTVRRGDSLDGFAAAAALRSLPPSIELESRRAAAAAALARASRRCAAHRR
jgi:hypothetical protein